MNLPYTIVIPKLPLGLRFGVVLISVLVPFGVYGQSPPIRTERFDLPNAELGIVGNELTLDFLFPAIPTSIVNTRFNLTFETETSFGSFDAADIGLILQPPIDDPVDPDDRVLTLFRTGADIGWSGAGTFTFVGETDALSGPVLDVPPGTGALLYAVVLFHADRLTDPNNFAPLGGRFVDSFIEVDYLAVPEPATGMLVLTFLPILLVGRSGRWRRQLFG